MIVFGLFLLVIDGTVLGLNQITNRFALLTTASGMYLGPGFHCDLSYYCNLF